MLFLIASTLRFLNKFLILCADIFSDFLKLHDSDPNLDMYIATGDALGVVRIWDVLSGEEILSIKKARYFNIELNFSQLLHKKHLLCFNKTICTQSI